jgi:N-methylhydantoinase A/oxoprolinase/acetone carboxylase beta subunit
MIREHQMEIKMKAAQEKMKIQGQLLHSTQQTLSKQEFSSSAVANVMALVKNHMPEFDIEILRKDFTIEGTEWATSVDNAYDIA